MGQEIERKFLVKGDFKSQAVGQQKIVQGYLSTVPERTVRVRIKGDKGYITVKGIGSASGATRFEWEKEISINEVESLLPLCESGVIDKVRYLVKVANHTFEVDVFHGDNEGLVVAEVELSSENETFDKPEWLGGEVTGEDRYYNAMLMRKPYKDW